MRPTLPTEWSTKKNVAWAVDLPGRAWSSPIVWRDRVFVTTAISKGDFKEPSTGIFGNDFAAELTKQGLPAEEVNKRVIARDIELTGEAGDIRYVVMAIDARTGKTIWQQDAHLGKPAGGRHRKNTYASETPATDGERVYASFGGNVGCSVTRWTASCCGSTPGSRSRSISTSAPRRHPSSTAGACISCTIRKRNRRSPRSTRRPGRLCGRSSVLFSRRS
jgi:hypothetical protein